MHSYLLRLVLVGGVLFLLATCQRIDNVFKPESPRQKYTKALKESPLINNKMVQNWLASGDSVLGDAVPVDMPFQSKIVYFNDESNVWAWRLSLQEGRMFRAHLTVRDTSHSLFMDLFSLDDGGPVLETSAADSLISYTLPEDQTLIVRVQAELLVGGSATLTLTDDPSMEFPVQGGVRADIGSFWGDPREGGRRKHKGVDIFADRGTPVLAPSEGRVTRTGNGGLGGKTVWLRANGKAIYFAHLDSIITHMGAGVQTGDTLGFVGNTGNARTTPPHLHFGIYDRGAINPLPFIDFTNDRVQPITADPSSFPKWGRIASVKANVRPLPSTDKAPLRSLVHHNPVKMVGGTGEWYQVKLPDDTAGFIHRSLVEPAGTRIQQKALDSDALLYQTFTARQPFVQLNSTHTIDLFGSYNNMHLTKYQNHWVWVN